MSVILKFPPGGRRFDLRVEREADGPGWVVRTYYREHSWLHGSFDGTPQDAAIIARGFGVGATSTASAGRVVP